MPSARLLTWLHRIGYVTTVIVAIELIALGVVRYRAAANGRSVEARMRDAARTHDGPLLSHAPRTRSPLSLIPELTALSGDSLSLIAKHSLQRRWYAISLSATGDRVEGLLATVCEDGTGRPDERPNPTRFALPRAEWLAMAKQLDRQTDGYDGGQLMSLDGVSVAFERRRGARITSGTGNTSHYMAVGEIVRKGVAPYLSQVAALEPGWVTTVPFQTDCPTRGDGGSSTGSRSATGRAQATASLAP